MAGVDAFGTSLARDNGSTFDAIASITSVSGPGISRDTVDVTAHDSADRYREFIGGLVDGGEVSADINWDPKGVLGAGNATTILMGDLEDPNPVSYEIAFPDGSKFAAALLITGFEPDAPHDDKLTASLSFKVSGKPTFTPAV